jgi:predicted Fe-Mo cluster-binding NifX family protein
MNNILFVSDNNNIGSKIGHHFGHANWYLIVAENGDLVNSIEGDKKSQKAMIFKQAETLGFNKVIVKHLGAHAWKVAQKWGVKVYFIDEEMTIPQAWRLFQSRKLKEVVDEPSNGDHHHHH